MIRLPECPICKKSVPPATDPNASFAPFCSRRCKEVDLIRWCEGRYAIVDAIDPNQLVDSRIDDLAAENEDDSFESEDDSYPSERQ